MTTLAQKLAPVLRAVQDASHTGDMERLDAELSRIAAQWCVTERAARGSGHVITKLEPTKRLVYGWGSVMTEGGTPLVDLQHDVIDAEDMRETAHDFIRGDRTLGRMHSVMGVGEVVESIVLTKDIQQALGIDLGMEGWFVGVKVTDEDTWKRIVKGEFRMFSIGGSGERVPLDKARRRPVLFAEVLAP